MISEYSHEDFAKMQQQAINRVHEMQRQSKINSPKNEQTPQHSEPKFIRPEEPKKPPKRIFEPKEHEVFCSPPPITHVHSGKSKAVSSFFEMDSDVALILPLLLLLQRDGADEMLILALLYIMA